MRHLIFCILTPFFISSAHAQSFNFFGTYWENKRGKSYEAVGLGIPSSDMQKAFDLQTDDGYELTKLDGYSVEGQPYFNFVFRTRTSNTWVARFGLSAARYQDVFDNQVAAGRCLRSLDVYPDGNRARYAAVFKSHRCRAQRAYHNQNATQHQQKFNAWTAQGWRPVNVSVTSIGGNRIYAAFYEKRSGATVLKSFLTRDQLAEESAKQAQRGRRIAYLDAYIHDQGQLPRFSAIWRKLPKTAKAWANAGGPQVSDMGQEMHGSNRYVRYMTGYGLGASHRFDVGAYKPQASGAVGGISN